MAATHEAGIRTGCLPARLPPLKNKTLYGAEVNRELLRLMGQLQGRVLDVGCGQGAWAEQLRAAGAAELIGVEVVDETRRVAATRYDGVLAQPVESLTASDFDGPFSWVIFADVLEHLVDPWSILRRSRSWATPDACMAVSVPNAQYYRISGALLAGRFNYTSSGVMDWTHLRWFTSSSLEHALRSAGWMPVHWGLVMGPRRRTVSRFTAGSINGLLAHQLHVVAQRSDD